MEQYQYQKILFPFYYKFHVSKTRGEDARRLVEVCYFAQALCEQLGV